MRCPLCGGRMAQGEISLPYEMDEERIVIVRKVPAWICKQCGESFVEIEVTRRVEEIVRMVDQDGVTLGFVQFKVA